ncbi:D-sedoheptulose 7-phosphate isomerase [Candidatus Marinamargulisbacteria bacterium SCGC AG-343-D04]|nr:D-sedoheptulose 7-phosphate isomerase [Candidatus Marinamargulisbacteria bacterium SCGC AG-343-D04]
MDTIKQSLLDARACVDSVLNDESMLSTIDRCSALVAHAFLDNKKVIICGNGGSACDAMHFSEEFTGRFKKDRKALPVISLTDPSFLTCVANDYGYDHVFQRGVEAYGQSDDVFIGISTSGNSKNVLNAFIAAKELGLKTVSFLGKDGGVIKGFADYEFSVSSPDTERIQEVHMLLLHIMIEQVERRLFPDLYR